MKASAAQYAQSLYESVSGRSEKEVKAILKNLVLLLDRNRELSKANEIIDRFQEIWNKQSGELYAELDTARRLNKESKELIIEYLKKQTGANKIGLDEKIKEDLIGGFVLSYDSKVVDGSLKNSLRNLRNKISN